MATSVTLPTASWQAHEHIQWIVWGVVADWFILFGRYKTLARYRWYNIHAIAMIFVNLVSMIFRGNNNKYGRLPNFNLQWMVTFHKTVALPSLLLSVGLVVAGFYLRYLIVTQARSRAHTYLTLTNVRRMHMTAGITMWVVIRLSLFSGSYIFCTVYNSFMFTSVCIETVAFLVTAFYMEKKLREQYREARIRLSLSDRYEYHFQGKEIVRDLKNNAFTSMELTDMYNNVKVFLFLNRVYLMPDKFVHPGGQYLLNKCNFKDITRYIFGVTGLETESSHRWPHPALAFEQLNHRCIGDISLIHSNSAYFWNMRSADHGIAFTREIWHMTETVKLSPDVTLLKFKNEHFYLRLGIKGMAWMGKHFAVTGKNGKTRLYSNCTALTPEMDRYMTAMMDYSKKVQDDPHCEDPLPIVQKVINYLPLAVKLYNDEHALSKELHFASSAYQCLIEGPLGRGYEFRSDFNGTITLIVGGTGYIPFVDLIAELFVKTIFSVTKLYPPTANFVKYKSRYDTILPFAKLKLIASFNKLEDFFLHKYVSEMYRIDQEHNLNKFDCLIRLSSGETIDLPTTSRHFDQDTLRDHVLTDTDFVILCGPQAMTVDVYQTLTQKLNFPTEDIIVH